MTKLKKLIKASLLLILLTANIFAASSLTLSWIDNSNNETGFKIERRVQGGNFAKLIDVGSNVTSFTDETLTPGRVYLYRVQAFNGMGFSGYTNTVSKTAPNTAPKIGFLGPRTIPKNTNSGRIPLVISDAESSIDQLNIVVTSNNAILAPIQRIIVSRTPEGIFMVVTPVYNQSGVAEITVRVSDGLLSWSSRFNLTVRE